jgi:hypothetical protein
MSIRGFNNTCKMGMGKLADPNTIYKRKFRWKFKILKNGNSEDIDDIIGDGLNALPPLKGARPNLEFKDIEVQHVTEDVYLPGKPSWKPVNFILYDVCPPSSNPIWDWILKCYEPNTGKFYPILDKGFKKNCVLQMLSGCGDTIETWYFMNAYPSQINWGDLDMSSSEIVTCDILLRYDRACLNKCTYEGEE